MHKPLLPAAVLVVAFATSTSSALAAKLIPVPMVPGSTSTTVTAINDSTMITGDYVTADGTTHGFVGTLDGNYVTFDFGDLNDTDPTGINNDGYVVGYSFDDTNHFYGPEFVRKPSGTLLTIVDRKHHGAALIGVTGEVAGQKLFVGSYWDENHIDHGYLGKDNTFMSEIVLPFDTDRTNPRGLNAEGTIVGSFRDNSTSKFNYRGFVLEDGNATPFDYPDPSEYHTLLEAVNDDGMVAGFWEDQQGTFERAFIYDLKRNKYHDITVPGATSVVATGINNNGVVAIAADGASYVFCPKKACRTGADGRDVPEKWKPIRRANSVVCSNRCLQPIGANRSAIEAPSPPFGTTDRWTSPWFRQ